MRVGEQRFTAWHRTHVKMNLLPGHWVRVQVSAGSKLHNKKWLRYVTIIDEVAERDRAYEMLALVRSTYTDVEQTSAQKVALSRPKTKKTGEKIASTIEVSPEAVGDVVKLPGVTGPVLGTLGGASGEAVLPEEVKVVGVSARGRVLKRREIVAVNDDVDDDFVTPAAGSNKKRGKKALKKMPQNSFSCKQQAASSGGCGGRSTARAREVAVAVSCGGEIASETGWRDLSCTPQRQILRMDRDERGLSEVATAVKALEVSKSSEGCEPGGSSQSVSISSPPQFGVGASVALARDMAGSGVGALIQSPPSSHTSATDGVAASTSGVGSGGGALDSSTAASRLAIPAAVSSGSVKGVLKGSVSEGDGAAAAAGGGAGVPLKRKRGPYKKKCKGASEKVAAPDVRVGGGGAGAGAGGRGQGHDVVEVSSDDEADIDSQRSQGSNPGGGAAGNATRGDDVFELLLWMITVDFCALAGVCVCGGGGG